MVRALFLMLVLIGSLAAIVLLLVGLGVWQAVQIQQPEPILAAATSQIATPATSPATAGALPGARNGNANGIASASPANTAIQDAAAAKAAPIGSSAEIARAGIEEVGDASHVILVDKATLLLPVSAAVLDGFDIRLEGEGANRTIVNWVTRTDMLHWEDPVVPTSGLWELEIEYACDPNEGGGAFLLMVGRSRTVVGIQPTSGWNDYQKRAVTRLYLREGTEGVVIRPLYLPENRALMNIRSAKLTLIDANIVRPDRGFRRRQFE